MRRPWLLLLSIFAIALPVHASGRHQSYFTYDDGGTVVRQGEDGREIEARVNLPVFPGDEVTTNRRGRAEIRLADGNVIGVDRATAVRFQSILDSYDGDSSETVAQLRHGHVIVQRANGSREYLRLDTDNASYLASQESIYSVETDRGRDLVTVFDGSIEVRTPNKTVRLRAGEEARVDDRGAYAVAGDGTYGADDFERWFLRRAERYGRGSSRYLDRSIAYADSDLAEHGRWVYVGGFNSWVWRPHVSVGWRPYFYGHWNRGRSGSLVWVSYEPWGWVPYHYGRWAHDAGYGWVWLPSSGYAPAWVYWMYAPNYIGWAPAGWYDCYRPYYTWCYRPYANVGFGFYGRVRINEIDLRPWTFVNSTTLVSNRVDRAALTTDAVRQRLARGSSSVVTVSGEPARFTRSELQDPAAAAIRRGIGSGTGKGTGAPADMTPFFRRDPELSTAVRDRIIRAARPTDSASRGDAAGTGGSSSAGERLGRSEGKARDLTGGAVIERGVLRRTSPADSSGREPSQRGASGGGIDREGAREGDRSGTSAGTGRGGLRRSDPGDGAGSGRAEPGGGETPGAWREGGGLRRGEPRERENQQPAEGQREGGAAGSPGWRERVQRPVTDPPAATTPPAPSREPSRDQSWRGRAARGGDAGGSSTDVRHPVPEPRTGGLTGRPSEIPRIIIDAIGGARLSRQPRATAPTRDTPRVETPRSNTPRSDPPRTEAPRDEAPRERPAPAPSEEKPSNSGGRVKRGQ